MAFVNNVNSSNNFYAISAFGNTFLCDDEITDAKTVSFPEGYNEDSNLSFKVIFANGHNCANSSSNMTLNNKPVVVNKYGTLIPIPIHEMVEGGTTLYKTLQANTILEMYYTSDYDGIGNSAFVVIGNPIVLSSADYTIYADGKVGDETIGDVKASSLAKIPYGWLECNGQAISRSTYSELFTKFSNQLYDDPSGTQDPTHTLLSRYGEGDGSTTFNLPDYRECALVGIGSNGTFIIDNTNQSHEIHTLGEFKDDQLQTITGELYGMNQCNNMSITASGAFVAGHSGRMEYQGSDTSSSSGASFDSSRVTRGGTTTHGKQIGVTYLIKVL